MTVERGVTQGCESIMKVVGLLLMACRGGGGGSSGGDGGGLGCAGCVTHGHRSSWPSTLAINCRVNA